jgi:geranylgeranyl diphosphate synthase type I
MSDGDAIKEKLKVNAEKVDSYIDNTLKVRSPVELYEASRHLIMAGGKRLRPYLVMKACELVGGDPDRAVPLAASLEVLHNFTLIHDDIMDNDDLRRGVITVHAKWGIPLGIASGDLLFAMVYSIVLDAVEKGIINHKEAVDCIANITESAIAICEGQVLDTEFPNMEDVTEEDYIKMVGGKTSALFKACARIGAIVGGGSKEQVEALGDFAWNAGIAFQIVDDVLGATSDEETLGKPVGSDLREGKKTLIVLHALMKGTKTEREAILKVLGVANADEKYILKANDALKSTGGLAYANQQADLYTERALGYLMEFGDSKAKRELDALIHYFTERVY